MDNQYYLFAKEDIYDSYHKEILYLKDELIGSISVLKKERDIHYLPRGVYYLQSEDEMNFHEICVEERLESWQYFENVLLSKQTISIDLKVVNNYTNEMIENVHCGLFAGEDIYDNNHCLVYFKDDLILDMMTNSKEVLRVPLLNINEGTFYIQQIDTIEGYFGNTEKFYFKVNFNLGKVNFNVVIENQPTMVEILKKDEVGEFVKGAWLAVYDEKGVLVDEWISEEEHVLFQLVVGKRYVLKEKETPDGYMKSEEVFFVVKNCQQVQKVEMINYKVLKN